MVCTIPAQFREESTKRMHTYYGSAIKSWIHSVIDEKMGIHEGQPIAANETVNAEVVAEEPKRIPYLEIQ